MTTIINDTFNNGSSVSMDVDKDGGELFVFHFQSTGEGESNNVVTKKWPLDSYHLPIAMAYYEQCCATELQRLNTEA